MFLVDKLISCLYPQPQKLPTYILVDCDTCPDLLVPVVKMFDEREDIFIHGYSTSPTFLVPDSVVHGHDIDDANTYKGSDYIITQTNPGYKALYRYVNAENVPMKIKHQINYVLLMVEDVYPGATCFVITASNDEIMDNTRKNELTLNIYRCKSIDDLKDHDDLGLFA